MIDNPGTLISPLGTSRLMQFAMNLVPLFGVIFFDWNVFALIYVFWLETLALSFFDGLGILLAQGGSVSGPHVTKAFRYFLFRFFILCFYMIFILVFIGLMVADKQGDGYEWIRYLTLMEPSFRLTVMSFFVIKLIEFIWIYIALDQRKTADPEKIAGLFDARIIVIHSALVLGFFAFDYFSQKWGVRSGLIAFTLIFTVLKVLVDYFGSKNVFRKEG